MREYHRAIIRCSLDRELFCQLLTQRAAERGNRLVWSWM